jgi:hypothetical protein
VFCLQAGSEDCVKQTKVSKDTRQPGQQQYRPVQLNNIPLPTTGGHVTCESNCFPSNYRDDILKYYIYWLVGQFFAERVSQNRPVFWHRKESESICCKIRPITGCEGPKREYRYRLTSALDGGRWSMPHLLLYTEKETRYLLYTWLGGRCGLSGRFRKISPHRDSIR